MPPTGVTSLAIATLIASLEEYGGSNLCLRYARVRGKFGDTEDPDAPVRRDDAERVDASCNPG